MPAASTPPNTALQLERPCRWQGEKRKDWEEETELIFRYKWQHRIPQRLDRLNPYSKEDNSDELEIEHVT